MPDTFFDKLRQFGVTAIVIQCAKKLFGSIWSVETFIVYDIPEPDDIDRHESECKEISLESLDIYVESGDLNSAEGAMLSSFLHNQDVGLAIELDGQLAAFGFVQKHGSYRFGRSGCLIIPPGVVIMKNLHVMPKFRGRGLGVLINYSRRKTVPQGDRAIVFVVSHNRIAKKNWVNMGASPIMQVELKHVLGASRVCIKPSETSDKLRPLRLALEACLSGR